MIELKGGRKQSSSMLTLLTKSPLPKGINSMLLNGYGYPHKRDKALHTALPVLRFNALSGNLDSESISRQTV